MPFILRTPLLMLTWLLLTAAAPIRIVATTTPLAAIASAVGGDLVVVDCLARGNQDPHFVDAKPSLVVRLRDADLLVVNGLELEAGWLPQLLAGARNPRIQPGSPGFLDASAGIPVIDVPVGPIGREAGDVHASGNPHYWLDPSNGVTIATNLLVRLQTLAPAHGGQFSARAAAFQQALQQRLEGPGGWLERMRPYHGTRVYTFHKSWGYFLNRFGLVAAGTLEPVPGIPPTPQHLLQLIQMARETDVRLILVEPFYNPAAARVVAEKSRAQVLQVDDQPQNTRGGEDYFALFDQLVGTVIAALESSGGNQP